MRKVLYILGQLSDDDVDWMARTGLRRRVPAGETIIVQGRPIDDLCILLEGRVSVTIDGLGQVAELGAGEIMGEMSLVDSRPPSASITTLEPTLILSLSKDLVFDRLERDVGFAARFYKAIAIFLSNRMRGTVRSLGYAKGGGIASDEEMEDEIDLNVMDTLHRAGARFDRMLKRLSGAAGPATL